MPPAYASGPFAAMSETHVLPWDHVTLVLGGARSGKSRYAESCAAGFSGTLSYVATARHGDAAWNARIENHRLRRGARWRTVEAPLELPEAISKARQDSGAVLVDCLTLWLTNLLLEDRPIQDAHEALGESLSGVGAPVILVSNEVGQGVIPDNELARRFVDEAGLLHQFIADHAARVVMVFAGLPLILKGHV